MKTKLSICIPTYNRPTQLIETLKSILSGSLPYKTEIIVSDDSQNYKTSNLVKRFSSKNKLNVKYVRNNKHGQFDNLNNLLDTAFGEWILFIHDDDLLNEKYFLTLSKYFDNNKYKMIWTGRELINDKLEHITSIVSGHKGSVVVDGKKYLLDILFSNGLSQNVKINQPMVTGLLIKSKIAKAVRFDTHFSVNADSLFLWKSLNLSDKCLYIDEPLLRYRYVDNSERSKPSEKGVVYGEMKGLIDNIIEYLSSERKLAKNDIRRIYENFFNNTLSVNGSLIWIALRYKGGYVDRMKIIFKIINEIFKYNYRLVLKPMSIFIILVSLAPQSILKLAYKVYLQKAYV